MIIDKMNNVHINNASLLILVAFVTVVCGCDSDSPVNPEQDEEIEYDENAMLMDLYLSDQLLPSGEYHDKIVLDKKRTAELVDSTYKYMLGMKFYFPYIDDQLIIGFDDATTALIDTSLYSAWDSLNEEYQLQGINKSRNSYSLYFECCLHMGYLEEIYKTLPGVLYVNKNWTTPRAGMLYPRAYGDTISYAYRRGHNCEWGSCATYEYLYVRSINREVEIVGYWNSYSSIPRPAWMQEVKVNMDTYWYYFYD
jgi:hypothetical protein